MTDPSVRPGDVLGGKYEIERVLGAGGMGFVVVARHVHFEDRVALKLLHPTVASRPDVVERFLREGRAARRIRSEHVVQITDVDVMPGGSPYLVMEYLEGSDLAELVRVHGPLPVETAAEYVLQVCEALAEAHAQGIIHRDLKPANLFLTTRSDGTSCVKVLDFGISKIAGSDQHLTTTSATMGTPLYMSPEQLQVARDVDAGTDIWALGVILYELVSGRPPFQADTLPQLAVKIIMGPATPLETLRSDLPPALVATIDRCLEKRREDRWENVAALARALLAVAPARARISVERAERRLGVTGISPSAAPLTMGRPGGPRISITTDPNAGATVPFGMGEAATIDAPSTIGGTTKRSLLSTREPRPRRVAIGAGVGLAISAIAIGAWFLGRSPEHSASTSSSSPTPSAPTPVETPAPPTHESASEKPNPPPPEVSTVASPSASASAGAASSVTAAPTKTIPTNKKPIAGKPATTASSSASSATKASSSGKSNEDY